MLVQPSLPCLPFKGVTWLTLGEINLAGVSFPVYSRAPLENSQCSLTGRKNKCCREPLHLSDSAARRDLCTHSCLFAKWESTGHIVCQRQFIKPVRAVCIDYHCPFHQKRSQRIKFTPQCSKVWPSTLSRKDAGDTYWGEKTSSLFSCEGEKESGKYIQRQNTICV